MDNIHKSINKILIESNIIQLPKSVKKLKHKYGMYDIDVNSIFFNNYSSELRKAESALEDNYDWSKAKKKYGVNFMDTGVIETVIPLSLIYPGQPGLESKNLLAILNATNITSLPEAVKVNYDNKNYIVLIDGHHRVACKILKGEESVKLKLKIDNYI